MKIKEQNNMAKFISKLCKENKPEACMDCLSIRCQCYCHKQDEDNWDDFEPHGDRFPDED